MHNTQPVYVTETTPEPNDNIGLAVVALGALATAGLWVNWLFNWMWAVLLDPFGRPVEAAIAAAIALILAYYAWRTVRMAYLMTCALCFLIYDSGRKIVRYLQRRLQ